MISDKFLSNIKTELEDLKKEGLYKGEYEITSQQSADIEIFHQDERKKVINFCANNYLGLANDRDLIEVGKRSLDDYGLGTASALDVGTGANQVMQLDAAGKAPAVDGSNLTGISAGVSAAKAHFLATA